MPRQGRRAGLLEQQVLPGPSASPRAGVVDRARGEHDRVDVLRLEQLLVRERAHAEPGDLGRAARPRRGHRDELGRAGA